MLRLKHQPTVFERHCPEGRSQDARLCPHGMRHEDMTNALSCSKRSDPSGIEDLSTLDNELIYGGSPKTLKAPDHAIY